MTDLNTRIENKEKEIGKLVAKFDKYSKLVSEEFLALINQFLRTGDRTAIREYANRTYRFRYLEGDDYELYATASNLYDARNTLEKYLKQLKAESDKNVTLANIPQVIKDFESQLINRWDRYDLWKREEIKSEYRNTEIDYKKRRLSLNNKWGRGWYDFMHLTDTEIHKLNVKAAETLILNMVNRVTEICGVITDAQDLYIDRDNNGYAIINGLVIGEQGKARIESIGAGGYNIQRYHIRVLVKAVK